MYYNTCSSNYTASNTYPSPCYGTMGTMNYGNNYGGSCGCGCGFQVTPITMPETTNCSHCCHYHEQPVIVPVEHRMVHHHAFTPRYYGVARYTSEDVVEANPYMNVNATGGIYPNFSNM